MPTMHLKAKRFETFECDSDVWIVRINWEIMQKYKNLELESWRISEMWNFSFFKKISEKALKNFIFEERTFIKN